MLLCLMSAVLRLPPLCSWQQQSQSPEGHKDIKKCVGREKTTDGTYCMYTVVPTSCDLECRGTTYYTAYRT